MITMDGHEISSTARRSDRICESSIPLVTMGTVMPSLAGSRGQSSSNSQIRSYKRGHLQLYTCHGEIKQTIWVLRIIIEAPQIIARGDNQHRAQILPQNDIKSCVKLHFERQLTQIVPGQLRPDYAQLF